MCDMNGCDYEAIETIKIEDVGREETKELNVCLKCALEWKIGWLFAEYEIPVTQKLVHEFVVRALAEYGEELYDRQGGEKELWAKNWILKIGLDKL